MLAGLIGNGFGTQEMALNSINLSFNSVRLQFSPLSDDDLQLGLELWTDPEITKFVGGPRTIEELTQDHHKYIRRCAGGAIGVWTLTPLGSDDQIGTCILLPMPIEEDDTDWDLVVGDGLPDAPIEVGYILKKSAWGKGYATEACTRMIDFGFENTELEEIVASIDRNNMASGNVLIKSGLKPAGDQLSYGEICPFFRITRDDWKKKHDH